MLPESLAEQIRDDGFAVVSNVIGHSEIAELRTVADSLLRNGSHRGGVRNALGKSVRLAALAREGAPARLAATVLGPRAVPVKLTIFDKTPQANWKVPWHQDLTIAVAERREASGFGPWSVKDGVPHVQPPASVLEAMLAVRVHLDDTPPSNGALRVLPGTHKLGRIPEQRLDAFRTGRPEMTCSVAAGGAMIMRPLLLHASSPSHSPTRRRVLHIEYSNTALPDGLLWA